LTIQKLNGIVSAAFTISNKQGLEYERLKLDNEKLHMYARLLEDKLSKKPNSKRASSRPLQPLNNDPQASQADK
jgi:hypothetical protein